VRGDDLPRSAPFQPRIGPNLAHLCARLGLVFAESMFTAIDNGDTVSEEMHFGLIEPTIMRGACALLVLQFIGFGEAGEPYQLRQVGGSSGGVGGYVR